MAFADDEGFEAVFCESFDGEDGSTVEEEGGLEHEVVDAGEIQVAEFIPFGEDGEGVGAFGGLIGVGDDLDVEIDDVLGDADFEEVAVDGFLGDAGIVDDDVGVFGDEVAADVDRGGFAGVVGVLLEGEAEDRDTFAGDRVEESADDLFHEAGFLPVVHGDDRAPVGSRLGEVEGFAEVDEVEYVLLETRTAEADRGFEEFRTDPGVAADGSGDLIYVRTGGLAECGDGVD